jgi:hypothetical protein
MGYLKRTPLHRKRSNINVDIWHPAVGLRCRNPPRHLSQLKARKISLIEAPNGQELCRPYYIFHGIFIETPLHIFVFKYQTWYLTPYCGFEVQKLTQALQSVKGLGYTFDLNPKWERTMPSFDILSWVIYRVPPNPNIKVVYRDSSRNISGEQRGACHWVCVTEVTSPEATLTGNDVTWSHVTGIDVITGSIFCTCPEGHSRAFFLTIAVVRNVQLRMTGSSMANGCDMNGSHVTRSDGTGSDVIFPALFSYYSISIKCIIAHDRQ